MKLKKVLEKYFNVQQKMHKTNSEYNFFLKDQVKSENYSTSVIPIKQNNKQLEIVS